VKDPLDPGTLELEDFLVGGNRRLTLGSHQTTIGKSQTWITPKWIIDSLGPFDLDPCAADPRPWDCADINFTECGLEREWSTPRATFPLRVWLNPPFHRYQVGAWIERLASHGNGIALLHARTEAAWFVPVWTCASAVLFLADRLYFHYPDGKRAEANSGAPACLVAFGEANAESLKLSGIPGYLMTEWSAVPAR